MARNKFFTTKPGNLSKVTVNYTDWTDSMMSVIEALNSVEEPFDGFVGFS